MSEPTADATPLEYAMDRLAIWKAAVAGMRDMSMVPTPVDALYLAEFLAGDRIPGSIVYSAVLGDEEASDDA